MLQTTIALGEHTASDSKCAGLHSELKVAAPVGMPNLYATGRLRGVQCGKAGEDEFPSLRAGPKAEAEALASRDQAVDHVGRQLINPADG